MSGSRRTPTTLNGSEPPCRYSCRYQRFRIHFPQVFENRRFRYARISLEWKSIGAPRSKYLRTISVGVIFVVIKFLKDFVKKPSLFIDLACKLAV